MGAVAHVAAALPDATLCLPAANALRDLCDANRAALAPHVAEFAALHARLAGIPVRDVDRSLAYVYAERSTCGKDMERSKVLQSIASVIQALPPEEEIPPVEVRVAMLSFQCNS